MKNWWIFIAIICGLTLLNGNLLAQRNPEKQKKTVKTVRVAKPNHKKVAVVKTNQFSRNKVVVIKQRNVRTIPTLAVGYTKVAFKGRNYYYHGGRYYDYSNNYYTVIAPPRGVRVKSLPIGNRRILIGNVPHYYYMGTYYRVVENEYETVQPKVGTIVPELPEYNVDEITIDEQTYYEYDNMLYKPIVTISGVQYEVVGSLED